MSSAKPDSGGADDGAMDEGAATEQPSTSASGSDDSVTTIMPVIAAWPEPGAELRPWPPLPTHMDLSPAPPVVSEPPAAVSEQVEARTGAEPAQGPELPSLPDILDLLDKPGTSLVPLPRFSTDLVRPGPTASAEDSWDDRGLPVLAGPGPGGRHARLPSKRIWYAVAAVLVGLGAIAALPFALRSEPEAATEAAPDQLPTELDEPPPGFVPDAVLPTTPKPMSTGMAAPPKPTTTQPPNQTTQNSAPPPPPPFGPLAIEAEGGQTTGSARIWDGYPNASGGRLIRNIGAWGGTPGTLTLNEISFPNAAEYTITIYYVHPDGEVNRRALVTVSGLEPFWVDFVGNSNCCQTKAVTVAIPAGSHSIRFENSTGHSPSIDLVVITRV